MPEYRLLRTAYKKPLIRRWFYHSQCILSQSNIQNTLQISKSYILTMVMSLYNLIFNNLLGFLCTSWRKPPTLASEEPQLILCGQCPPCRRFIAGGNLAFLRHPSQHQRLPVLQSGPRLGQLSAKKRYLAIDLADSVIALIQGHDRHERAEAAGGRMASRIPQQFGAVQAWYALTEMLDFRTNSRKDIEDKLTAFFEIFDNYFFNGNMKARTVVHWADRLQGDHFGVSEAFWDQDGKMHACIRICLPQLPRNQWTPFLFQGALSVLLHEMVHSFFTLYACKCPRCECLVSMAKHQGVPGSGHGPLFREVCMAVAWAAFDTFGGTLGGEGWAVSDERGKDHWSEITKIFDLVARGDIKQDSLAELLGRIF